MTGLDLGRWSALVVVGGALAASFLLPPSVTEVDRVRPKDVPPGPAELEYREVRAEAATINDRLKRTIWLREMMAAPVQRTEVGNRLAVSLPTGLPADLETRVRTALHAAVDHHAPVPAESRVGYFVIDSNRGGHPELSAYGVNSSQEYYLGEDGKGDYCFAVRVHRQHSEADTELLHRWMERRLADPSEAASSLGACLWVAAFGAPGPEIREWVESGGHAFAEPPSSPSVPTPRPASFRESFGLLSFDAAALPLATCASGDAEVCERLFLDPVWGDPLGRMRSQARSEWKPRESVASFTTRGRSWVRAPLLHRARVEFGDGAFARFWRSDQPVQDAFESAFGVSLAEWMEKEVEREAGTVLAGPGLPRIDFGGSIAFLLVALLVTLHVSRQRSARGNRSSAS